MQRKFFTNLLFLLFINLLIKPFWIFGIDRNVQNLLGSEVYGEYFVLFNFSLLLNIVLDLGITNFNNRNISQNQHLISKHLPSIFVLKLLLGAVYLTISLIGAYWMGFSSFRIKLLLFLGLNQFLVSLILYLRSNISGLHLFRTDSIISVLDRILMIVFCAMLMWGNISSMEFSIELFIYAQTLAYLLTAVVSLVLLSSRASIKNSSWNSTFLIAILKKSLPYALLVMLMYFYNRIDAIMLDMILPNGAKESGLYAQAYRLLDAVNMIGFLTAGLLYPIFSYLLKQKESISELVKLSFSLLISIALPAAVISWVYAQEIMDVLYHSDTTYSAEIFRLLMIAFIPVASSYVFGTLLTANGSLKTLNIIAFGGLFLNVTLNYLIIPKYGAVGSAFTTLITQIATVSLQLIVAISIFNFKPNLKVISSLILFSLGTIAMGYFSKKMPVDWFPQMVITLILMITLAFITRLISIRSIISILKYDKNQDQTVS